MTHRTTGAAPLAYIFDMDGTILDNMHLHTSAWMRMLPTLGITTYTPERWERETSGVPNREIMRSLLKLDLDDAAIHAIGERKEAEYRAQARGQLRTMPGFHGFMTRIKSAGLRTAVATGAPPEAIALGLGETRLFAAFDAVVGAADVARGKPEPDIFLAAAERIGVPPAQCIVFEDAPMGVEAARRAGMRAVVIQGMMSDADVSAFPNVIRAIKTYDGLAPDEIALPPAPAHGV
jgi:beta-phosphoglucomutase